MHLIEFHQVDFESVSRFLEEVGTGSGRWLKDAGLSRFGFDLARVCDRVQNPTEFIESGSGSGSVDPSHVRVESDSI